MNTKPVLIVGGLGVLAYLLYREMKSMAAQDTYNANAARQAAYGLTPAQASAYTSTSLNASVPGISFTPSSIQPGILQSTLTAVPATTAGQVQAAVSFWSTLTPVVPLASGYIVFPSGAQAAATTFGGGNTAMDGGGNLYVSWAGNVYQLGDRDSAGNYPALLVTPA